MIEVHLYGKLRRFSGSAEATSQSIVLVEAQRGDNVGRVVDRLGIPRNELGSNIFLNGTYATLEASVQDGDRLGLFPDDMQLLYKWYFAPKQASATPKKSSGAPTLGSAASQDRRSSREPKK